MSPPAFSYSTAELQAPGRPEARRDSNPRPPSCCQSPRESTRPPDRIVWGPHSLGRYATRPSLAGVSQALEDRGAAPATLPRGRPLPGPRGFGRWRPCHHSRRGSGARAGRHQAHAANETPRTFGICSRKGKGPDPKIRPPLLPAGRGCGGDCLPSATHLVLSCDTRPCPMPLPWPTRSFEISR